MSTEIIKKEKIKLSTIVNYQVLNGLSALAAKQLPARTSYWLGKVIVKINSHVKAHDETRLDALKKYADLKEDGSVSTDDKGNAIFKDGKDKLFTEEMKALGEDEVEILKISSEAIMKDDFKIEANIFAAIDEILY